MCLDVLLRGISLISVSFIDSSSHTSCDAYYFRPSVKSSLVIAVEIQTLSWNNSLVSSFVISFTATAAICLFMSLYHNFTYLSVSEQISSTESWFVYVYVCTEDIFGDHLPSLFNLGSRSFWYMVIGNVSQLICDHFQYESCRLLLHQCKIFFCCHSKLNSANYHFHQQTWRKLLCPISSWTLWRA